MTWKLPAFVTFFAPLLGYAEFPTSQPFVEIHYQLVTIREPLNRLHVVKVDLSSHDVLIKTARAGKKPPATEPYQTSLLGPVAVAQREGFDVVVNGDFFAAKRFTNAQGKVRGLAPGDPANPHGPAETDGVTWATTRPSSRPALVVTRDHHVRIQFLKAPPPDAVEVLAGSTLLLKDSKIQTMSGKLATDANPRTAVGLANHDNTLVIVVDDGRWKDHSLGLSLPDLAKAMLDLGCTDALNLDGGGSTEMAIRDPATGKLVVVNHPSDGHERPVANVLGVRIERAKIPASSGPRIQEHAPPATN